MVRNILFLETQMRYSQHVYEYICMHMYVQIPLKTFLQLLSHSVPSGNGVPSTIGEVLGCIHPDIQVMFLKQFTEIKVLAGGLQLWQFSL